MSDGQHLKAFGLLVTLLEQLGRMGFPRCPPSVQTEPFVRKMSFKWLLEAK